MAKSKSKFKVEFKDPQIAARYESLAGRFLDLLDSTTEDEFINLFHLIEYQLYGTRKNLENQLKLLEILDQEKISLNPVANKVVAKLSFLNRMQSLSNIHMGEQAKLINSKNLAVNYVTWEDTGRNKNSCWGSNISDLYMQMEYEDRKINLPVLRSPNFGDTTADIDPEKFMVAVGNSKGKALEQKSLAEILREPWKLLTDESKWPKDKDGNPVKLFSPGVDKKILVSSQMCYVPVSEDPEVKINYRPVIYNYQSKKYGDKLYPSCLTLMITREGVSLDVLGKQHGQVLSFNKAGERAPLTVKRADEIEKREMKLHEEMGLTAQDNSAQHNRVLIIQIPLVPPPVPRSMEPRYYSSAPSVAYKSNVSTKYGSYIGGSSAPVNINYIGSAQAGQSTLVNAVNEISDYGSTIACSASDKEWHERGISSRGIDSRGLRSFTRAAIPSVEKAVVGSGEVEGKYNEDCGEGWERDMSLPIRVTVQLVMSSLSGELLEKDIVSAKKELEKVYDTAKRVGSLVE